jgi:long-chain acyl-CoA synthetase
MIDFLLDGFAANRDRDALVWRGETVRYGWLLERVQEWTGRLDREGVPPGTVAAIEADFSPNSVALFLALADRRCVIVPLTSAVAARRTEFLEI